MFIFTHLVLTQSRTSLIKHLWVLKCLRTHQPDPFVSEHLLIAPWSTAVLTDFSVSEWFVNLKSENKDAVVG